MVSKICAFVEAETYSLLEDGRIWIGYSLAHFLLGSVWAHNAVLALRSSLRLSPEVGLEVLIAIDSGLEPPINLSNLWGVPWATRLGLGLDVLDASDQSTVASHDGRAEAFDLARVHIWASQRLLEDTVEVGQLTIELVESTIDFAAFVKDGIRVGAASRVGLHL